MRRFNVVVVWLLLVALAACTPEPAADEATFQLPPGPWGQLTASPVRLAPPMDTVRTLRRQPSRTTWTLRDLERSELAELLSQLDLPDAEYETLLDQLQPLGEQAGYRITPTDQVIQALSPQARATLYHRLGRDSLNPPQINAFRYWGESVHDWFDGSGLSATTRQLIEPLVYRNGRFLFFADAQHVLPQLGDEAERLRLLAALASETTWLVTLDIPAGSDVQPLVDYWGNHGTAKEVRVLLESLARRPHGGSLDIVHLLPPFARQRLYTYPVGRDAEAPLSASVSRDCHWTALNFFNDAPNDDFARADVVTELYSSEFSPVEGPPALGDIVTFSHDGTIFHSAVYIAADILFTHNGTRASRPWMLLPMEAMKDFYPQPGDVTVHIIRRQG